VSVETDLIEVMGPWMTDDFMAWLGAIGSMFAPIELYAADQPDGTPGWAILFDPDTAPDEALDYLAQYVGERFPAGTVADDKRVLIKTQPNMNRGQPASIARAVQKWLTGSRRVLILERTYPDGTPDPNGDHFIVYTNTADTPYPNLAAQEVQAQCPFDMIAHYEAISAPTWAALEAVYGPTWTAIQSAFTTWSDAESATAGASAWTWET
jgi:hypothetical protein